MPVIREESAVRKKKKKKKGVFEFSWLSMCGFKVLLFGDIQLLN